MKKLLFFAMSLILMAGCSGNGASEKANEDSVRIADSIAKVEAAQAVAEQARLDSIAMDSIMQITIDDQYKNAITLNPGKKAVKQLFEHTDKVIDWTLNLTNNTDITLSPQEYTITYVEEYEDTTPYGDLEMFKKNRNLVGPELAPGATAVATIHNPGTEDIFNPKVKLLISKEEFAKRFKEETVFDKNQNKFISK